MCSSDLSVSAADADAFEASLADSLGENWCKLGAVGGSKLVAVCGGAVAIEVNVAAIAESYNTAIERRLHV